MSGKNLKDKPLVHKPSSGAFRDFVITLFCLGMAFLGARLFWRDLNYSLRRSETPVATISFKRNTAQRRFADRLLWTQLREESSVYNGDLIRTAELSDATISFTGGETIDMAENCLIQVFIDERGETRIELAGGNINVSAQGTGNMVVVSGDRAVNLSSGSVASIAAPAVSGNPPGSGNNLNVQVMSGRASVTTPLGIEEAEAGTALVLNADETAERKAGVVFLNPLPNQRIVKTGNLPAPVVFVWNEVNFTEEDRLRLEIAADRQFTRVERILEPETGSPFTAELGEGLWFWRSNYSGGGSITVIPASPPVLEAPDEGARYLFSEETPVIGFRWMNPMETSGLSPGGFSPGYLLEAADNPGMEHPSLAAGVQGFSFLSSLFDEGTWYWRVTPVYPPEFQGTPEASPVSSFIIEKRREEAAVPVPPPSAEPPVEIPPPPRIPGRVALRAPARGEGIPGLEAVRRPAAARWSAPEAVGSSRFILSRNPNPPAGPPIMDMANPPFTVPLPPLPPGTYYWTVQARTPEGLDMSPPEPFSFRVLPVRLAPLSLDAPPEGSLITAGDAQDRPGRLIWSSAEKPAFSRLILSRDPDPAAGVPVLDVLDPPFTVPLPPLPPGTYYWTVQARTPEGFNISPGNPGVFRVAPFPPLEAPRGMIPREGSTLQVGKNGTLNFSWEKTEDADAYILSFFNEADPETPLFQTEPRAGTAYIHRDVSALDTGNFFWRLEPLRTGPGGVPLRRGEKGECHFRIIVPRPESPRPRDPGTLYGN